MNNAAGVLKSTIVAGVLVIAGGLWGVADAGEKNDTGVVTVIAPPGPLPGGDLQITVTGLRSGNGVVRLAIYNEAEKFPEGSGTLDNLSVTAMAGSIKAVFHGLAAGTYAVAVYHDENDNDEFDQGFLWLPLEGYGFSNDARVFLGPPTFEDAAVLLTPDGLGISVQMVY